MATSQKSKRKLSLLPRLLIGIAAGILIGSLGNILHIAHTPGFTGLIRVIATFVALFS